MTRNRNRVLFVVSGGVSMGTIPWGFTVSTIEWAKTTGKGYKLSDGGGLYLYVTPAGGKTGGQTTSATESWYYLFR